MKHLFFCAIGWFCAVSALAQSPQPPEIAARAYLLVDVTASQVLAEKNADEKVEPASLTKLMTAMVAIDAGADLNRETVIDRSVGTRLPQRSHTRRDVFNALLVRSDNGAAETLAREHFR